MLSPSALRGLCAGRERRVWRSESILAAIADFERRQGRRPIQRETFAQTNGLPGYATLWRRFGSISVTFELARAEGNTQKGDGQVEEPVVSRTALRAFLKSPRLREASTRGEPEGVCASTLDARDLSRTPHAPSGAGYCGIFGV